MRKTGRKKARVSSHWNPQVPNFSITSQTALISEPILRLRIARRVSRWKRRAVPGEFTAIHACFACFPPEAQARTAHALLCAGFSGGGESYDVETAHRSPEVICQAQFLFCTRISPACSLHYLLFNHQEQSIFWFLY